MSKTLLSRIKPLHNNPKPKTPSPSNFPLTRHIKQLVNEICEILQTQDQWEHTVETRLSQEEIVPSDIAHHVFDKLKDPHVGLKFFDWVSKRPYGCPLDHFACSSLLKLLAKFRVFVEIESLLSNLTTCEDKFPTLEALDAVIKAYSDTGFVDKAAELYYFVLKTYDLVPHVVTVNSLLHGLVKHGKIKDARRLYDELIERSSGYVENKFLDNFSTCIIVTGLSKEGKVEEGRKLIEDRCGKGCIPNVVFYNTLIDGYCKKGDIRSAYALFNELKKKSFLPIVETYGALINGFCKDGNFEKVDMLVQEMVARGVIVNSRVYNTIIDAKCRHGFTAEAIDTVRKMVEAGSKPDIVTYNTLMSYSCKDEKIQEAEKFLEQVKNMGLVPTKFSYTPMIHAYCKFGDFERALSLLAEMTEYGDKPDVSTYGALVHGLVVSGEVDVALVIREKMIERGVSPDAGIYNVLMSGLCKKLKLSVARQLLDEMLDRGILPDVYVYATLVDGCVRNGEFQEAKKLFEQTIEMGMDLGLVGYNAMIKGYCKFGLMKDAVACMSRMKKSKIFPDAFTYSTLIDGYVKQHDLCRALMIIPHMIKHNCMPNVVTYSSLIYGFFQNGDPVGAENLFNGMQSNGMMPNVITYSILIGSFCKVGKLAKAASIFVNMLKHKCYPTDVTFNYLVNGFSHCAPTIFSKEKNDPQDEMNSMFMGTFKRMISDGWCPRTAAYNCIIICLCLHKMLKTALQLRDKMISKGYNTDSVTFAALLHGICLDGKSKEWKSIISCSLSATELSVALRFGSQLTSKFSCSSATAYLGDFPWKMNIPDAKRSKLEEVSSLDLALRRISNQILTKTDNEDTVGEWVRRYGGQVLLDLSFRRPIPDSEWNEMCSLIQVQFRENAG
ncbi:hypothetical protein K7X08_024312 [Anisodus acutangulus]|uniref:Pentatricopeptide repeat-containing protein n=1 Tax=Anisodus acutangulus TaxID=402998 RepID=A0A9Q1MAK7_9SOLA|nr:hypothetical protein K7X08_024312 [Anisodus acutangulus]